VLIQYERKWPLSGKNLDAALSMEGKERNTEEGGGRAQGASWELLVHLSFLPGSQSGGEGGKLNVGGGGEKKK